MTAPINCPICLGLHSEGATVDPGANGWGYRINCPICGRFDLVTEAWEDYLDPDSPVGRNFSALNRAHLSHLVKTATVVGSSGLSRLDSDYLERFANDGYPKPSPAEQAHKIIKYIGDIVAETGEHLQNLPPDFYATIGAANPVMAGELAIELMNRGLVDGVPAESSDSPPDLLRVNLTLDGWNQYEAEKRGKISGNYGFIAMQFDDPVLDPFVDEVLKPAVQSGIGYEVVDMRNVARAGIIDNIMRAQIRDAAFVIVDLTHDNSGAYWEAGYAEGLGKPVIYICEETKFEDAKTHFDTNHCTTVLWTRDQQDEFCEELNATLRRSLNLFEAAS